MSLTASLLPGVPLVESPFFEHDAPLTLSPEHLSVARELNEKGYAVFDFPDPQIGEKIAGIRKDFQDKYDWEGWRQKKVGSLRIQDAWKTDPRVMDIAANPKVLDLLSSLYGRRAFPFQTLNFAVGTQQAAHSDHAHFNSVPDRFMCGVWLAFEDTDEDNGPLFYYPGSHKWPSFQNEHLGVPYSSIVRGYPEYNRYVALWNALAEQQGLKREVFKAKKGQALIWAANLLHGGSVQNDVNRTRWSQVTHYFFEGCAYTTPVANDVYQGKILFRNVRNIQTDQFTTNSLSGAPIRENFLTGISNDFAEVKPEDAAKLKPIQDKIAASAYRNNAAIPNDFDPIAYVRANPDLIQAGVDPFEHYVKNGRAEKRRLR